MNKQQLREGVFDEVMSSAPDMNAIIAENATDSIMQLIDQYAYEYAERVIGEDTKEFRKKDYAGTEDLWDLANGIAPISTHEFNTWGSSDKAQFRKFGLKLRNTIWFQNEESNNELRAEQRKTNQELSSHGEHVDNTTQNS